MQRLYSTFPGAWPGFALLVLRCVAAVALITCVNTDGLSSRSAAVLLVDCAIVATATLLIGGLWTPAAGVAHALLQLYSHLPGPAGELDHVLWAIVGLCVAALGPGAWSIDSRLFGRKRIDLRSSSD